MSVLEKQPVAVLISGNGSNLQSLIDACHAPDYPAQIVRVISNQPQAYGLTRAKEAGIETRILSHKDFPTREAYDEALHQLITESGAYIVCLAGFMRLLTPGFVTKWQGRMLNIHPSLLPAFKGMHTHEQALAAQVKIHGCSVHHVTAEMDAGPLVAQAALRVMPGDTAENLRRRVLALEHRLYPLALQAVIAKTPAASNNEDFLIQCYEE